MNAFEVSNAKLALSEKRGLETRFNRNQSNEYITYEEFWSEKGIRNFSVKTKESRLSVRN